MSTAKDDGNYVACLDLKLHKHRKVYVSVHTYCEREPPSTITNKVKENPKFAIMDAHRVVSLSQLTVAANIALSPTSKSSKQSLGAWAIVLNAAGSTHFGHVMRDYAFGEEVDIGSSQTQTTTTENMPTSTNNAMIVAISLDASTIENHVDMTREVGLGPPQSLDVLEKETSQEQIEKFVKWYKITKEEIEMSSLEQAVLTRIATKYYT